VTADPAVDAYCGVRFHGRFLCKRRSGPAIP
jgi:hypothetical protein